MPYHPERGLGAADPGGHRTSGVSCRSYRTRLRRPEVSLVPETAAAPGPSERSGCRPPALGGQPRIQYGAGSVKPDRDPAGRGGCPQGPSSGICERSIIRLLSSSFPCCRGVLLGWSRTSVLPRFDLALPLGAVVSGVVRGPPAVPGWPGPAAVCGSGPSCTPG